MAKERGEEKPYIGHAIVVRNFQNQGFQEIHLAPGEAVLCLIDGSIVYSKEEEKQVTEDFNRLRNQTELLILHFESGGIYFTSQLLNNEGAIGEDTPHQRRLFPITGLKSLFIVGWGETEEELKAKVKEELERGRRILESSLN